MHKRIHKLDVGRVIRVQRSIFQNMESKVVKSLSILLGIFFIFIGLMKLTPKISKEMHKELRRDYVRFAKVFPFQEHLSFKMPSKWYRQICGLLEVLSGAALAFIPFESIKKTANFTLILLTAWNMFTHWQVQDKFERTAPTLVFFFMLTCRMVVAYQLQRKNITPKKESHQKTT